MSEPLGVAISTWGSIRLRPYLEWMGKSMSLELWQDPRVPLQFQVETDLLLRGDGDVGIPFQMKQGNRPSSRDEEGQQRSE